MKIYFLLKVLVIPCIIIFLYNIINWEIFLKNLLQVNIPLFFSGVIVSLFLPIIAVFRWQKILIEIGYKINFSNVFKVIMMSFSANLFAPAKSGDLIKIFAHTTIKNKSNIFSGLLTDRIADLIALSILCFFGSIYLKFLPGLFTGLFIFSAIFFLIVFINFFKFNFKQKLINKIYLILKKSFQLFYISFNKIFLIIFFALSQWLLTSFQVWLFFTSFNISIPFFVVIAMFPITVILSLIPLTPSGIGIREVSFVILFSTYSDSHVSLAVGTSYYLSSVVLPAFLGLKFFKDYVKKIDLIKLRKKFKSFF